MGINTAFLRVGDSCNGEDMLLTDEEIRTAWERPIVDITDGHEMFIAIQEQRAQKAIAKAQLKKVVEWGNEPCDVKEHYELNAKKRQCEACWQSLLEE